MSPVTGRHNRTGFGVVVVVLSGRLRGVHKRIPEPRFVPGVIRLRMLDHGAAERQVNDARTAFLDT